MLAHASTITCYAIFEPLRELTCAVYNRKSLKFTQFYLKMTYINLYIIVYIYKFAIVIM